jgi:hypothetical protein
MSFDINLEKNAYDVVAVEVPDVSTPNEVDRLSLTNFSRKVKTKGKGTKM